MLIDCHAHYEPRELDVPHALAKMDQQGIDKVALIPCINGPIPETPELLLKAVRVLLQRRPTRRLAELIHRATLTRDGDLRLKGEIVRIYRQPDNESVAEVLEAHPDRFLGWIFLNPAADPDVLGTLERWRAVPGFIGVKLHPHWHDYRTEILGPVLARCESLGLPVLIHLGFRKRGDFRSICERYPKLRVISAHAGFPFFRDLWAYRNAYPNLYVDLSSPYLDEPLVRATVEAMGPERCLYGTDAPYGFHEADGTYDYGEIRRWVERLPVTTAQREQMLGPTFARLLDQSERR